MEEVLVQKTRVEKRPNRKPSVNVYYISRLKFVEFVDFTDLIGVTATCKLISAVGGKYIQIPKLKNIKRRFLQAIIRAEFDRMKGTKISKFKRLAAKYNYSENGIRRIIENDSFVSKQEREYYKNKLPAIRLLDGKLLEIMKLHLPTLKRFRVI